VIHVCFLKKKGHGLGTEWKLGAHQAEGVAPSTVVYTAAIAACTKGGQWEQALRVFEQMATDPQCSPDAVAYNHALSACASAGQWERAQAMFARMKEERVAPTGPTYSSLMTAAGNAGEWQKALQVANKRPRRQRTTLHPYRYFQQSERGHVRPHSAKQNTIHQGQSVQCTCLGEPFAPFACQLWTTFQSRVR
jgi:pentatricopeptide repeat protein